MTLTIAASICKSRLDMYEKFFTYVKNLDIKPWVEPTKPPDYKIGLQPMYFPLYKPSSAPITGYTTYKNHIPIDNSNVGIIDNSPYATGNVVDMNDGCSKICWNNPDAINIPQCYTYCSINDTNIKQGTVMNIMKFNENISGGYYDAFKGTLNECSTKCSSDPYCSAFTLSDKISVPISTELIDDGITPFQYDVTKPYTDQKLRCKLYKTLNSSNMISTTPGLEPSSSMFTTTYIKKAMPTVPISPRIWGIDSTGSLVSTLMNENKLTKMALGNNKQVKYGLNIIGFQDRSDLLLDSIVIGAGIFVIDNQKHAWQSSDGVNFTRFGPPDQQLIALSYNYKSGSMWGIGSDGDDILTWDKWRVFEYRNGSWIGVIDTNTGNVTKGSQMTFDPYDSSNNYLIGGNGELYVIRRTSDTSQYTVYRTFSSYNGFTDIQAEVAGPNTNYIHRLWAIRNNSELGHLTTNDGYFNPIAVGPPETLIKIVFAYDCQGNSILYGLSRPDPTTRNCRVYKQYPTNTGSWTKMPFELKNIGTFNSPGNC